MQRLCKAAREPGQPCFITGVEIAWLLGLERALFNLFADELELPIATVADGSPWEWVWDRPAVYRWLETVWPRIAKYYVGPPQPPRRRRAPRRYAPRHRAHFLLRPSRPVRA